MSGKGLELAAIFGINKMIFNTFGSLAGPSAELGHSHIMNRHCWWPVPDTSKDPQGDS